MGGGLSTESKLVRNGYRRDRTYDLWEGTDSKKHFLECEILNTTEERRMTLGVMKGKLEIINKNPYLTYWIMESLNGKSPRLDKERDLRRRRIVHRAYEGQNSIG